MNDADELAALVAGVLKDLDGYGALADWLQEHDREREAVLLRRRGASWKKQRHTAAEVMGAQHDAITGPAEAAAAELRAAGFVVQLTLHVQVRDEAKPFDDLFRKYVRDRFAGVRAEGVTHWCLDGNYEWGHVVLSESNGVCTTACGSMIWNGSTTKRPKGICARCRNKLPDLRRTPPPTKGD